MESNNTPTPMQEDGLGPVNETPEDELSILFIEGYGHGPGMLEIFRNGGRVDGISPFGSCRRFWIWFSDPAKSSHQDYTKPDAVGVERCVEEISSGKYHAIVVVDLIHRFEEFQEELGDHIQAFCQNGGVVAFPSSESSVIQPLKYLFNVTWTRSDYFRTTWTPCRENLDLIHHSFGNGVLAGRVVRDYSAKANTLRDVPPHERCFGVTEGSTVHSQVPVYDGRPVGPQDGDEDYDVVVAMHDYGKGVLAYFGDVNGEDETVQLVAAFVQSRAPKKPVSVVVGLTDDEFHEVKRLKDEGNQSFQQGELEEAIGLYKRALLIFGTKLGAHGPQQEVHATLYSNLSLIYSKLGQWMDSEEAAGKGIDIDYFHSKCRFRRAKACLTISRAAKGGDMARLNCAQRDVLTCCHPGDSLNEASHSLLVSIEAEMKRVRKMKNESFSKGFAKAL